MNVPASHESIGLSSLLPIQLYMWTDNVRALGSNHVPLRAARTGLVFSSSKQL